MSTSQAGAVLARRVGALLVVPFTTIHKIRGIEFGWAAETISKIMRFLIDEENDMDTAAAVVLMLMSCNQDGHGCIELQWERQHFASLEQCEAQISSAIDRVSLPDNLILARCDDRARTGNSRAEQSALGEGTTTVRVSRYVGTKLVVENFKVPRHLAR